MLQVAGKSIERDAAGYLKQLTDWSEAVAVVLAEEDGLSLTADHWQVIHFLRAFYLDHQTTPGMRALVKVLKNALGESIGNSLYLQKLFPKGPALQASKIAGLPKPVRCI